jgi:hypothetical protein
MKNVVSVTLTVKLTMIIAMRVVKPQKSTLPPPKKKKKKRKKFSNLP